MLTKMQAETLAIIADSFRNRGVAPTYREMRGALGLKSTSGVNRLVKALAERGFIRRTPDRARAIEIVRMPAPWVPLPYLVPLPAVDDTLNDYCRQHGVSRAAVIAEAVAAYLGVGAVEDDLPPAPASLTFEA